MQSIAAKQRNYYTFLSVHYESPMLLPVESLATPFRIALRQLEPRRITGQCWKKDAINFTFNQVPIASPTVNAKVTKSPAHDGLNASTLIQSHND